MHKFYVIEHIELNISNLIRNALKVNFQNWFEAVRKFTLSGVYYYYYYRQ